MSDPAPETSKNLQNASSLRKRPLSPDLALPSTKRPCRASAPTSRPSKASIAAECRQRTQTHNNRTPTPRPWTPQVVKAEIDDLPAALPVPARSLGRHPISAYPVAAPVVQVKTEPDDDRPPVARRSAVATDGAAVRANYAAGNINREPAADVHAADGIPADHDAGEDVPLDRGGDGAAEDFEEGRMQFDGLWNLKDHRGRRFLYRKDSKHEGRQYECEICGGIFLVGIYKENGKRKALANDDIDGHVCFDETNAGEPVGHEVKPPMTPAFEDCKIIMNPDGSIGFKDAQSAYEYNELRRVNAQRDGAGPSGSNV